MDKNNTKPVKRSITDKQKKARLANLEAGRKKRMEALQKKKATKENEQEYDLSSEEENDSSDSDDDSSFVVSRKKPVKKESVKVSKTKLVVSNDESNKLKTDVDELKNMVFELASMQKKQNKINKKSHERKSGGTKLVVLQPNNTPQEQKQDNNTMEALRRSLGM